MAAGPSTGDERPHAVPSRAGGLGRCVLAYVVALGTAIAAGAWTEAWHPIARVAAADVAATVAVFAFSRLWNNSSLYDPYWSVAPIVVAVWWACTPDAVAPMVRRVLVVALVVAWGLRLTWNWLRGWEGFGHEDWRYVDLRAQHGRAYWIVSFAGIHLFPTLIVLAGMLPLYPALVTGTGPLGPLDALALVVTAGAIGIEALADEQLRRFRHTPHPAGRTFDGGLWGWSRHPNYFGEMSFWWGLFLFGIAADPTAWWSGAGALAITLMFVFVSVPLLDARMLARRPDYAARMRTVSAIVPLPPRG